MEQRNIKARLNIPYSTAEYQRAYREKNPGKNMEYRISAAINLLTRVGYTITKPAPPIDQSSNK